MLSCQYLRVHDQNYNKLPIRGFSLQPTGLMVLGIVSLSFPSIPRRMSYLLAIRHSSGVIDMKRRW